MDKKTGSVAITFGAAGAALFAAPELQADIADLTFAPTSLPYSASASTNVLMQTAGGTIGTFSQWNDGIGKTLNFNSPGLASWTLVQQSQTLNNSTFTGVAGNLGFSTAASGTVYVGFRSVGGNVGWFAMDLGGVGGAIVWGPGQYGNAGENVHVGDIPAPGALAVLAMGAAGLRRSRKRSA